MSGWEYDVAVIGLGPTGAVLANLCGLYGLRTVVFEASSEPYPQPRACHLDAEIARVLAQCGFGDQLAEVLTVSAGMEFVAPDGGRVFSFEDFEREPLLGWHEDYVFVQPELDAMLRDGLRRFENVEVRVGCAAPPPSELLHRAHWVVGCDGASSGTRAALGIELTDAGFDQSWLVVDVSVDANDARVRQLPTIIQQVCDVRRLATFVPSHRHHRRWEFRLGDREQPDVWALLRPWGVDSGNSRLLRSVPYRFHALVADPWRAGPDGRVLLAGDAAHQMPPFMGQGMCSGIRDAAALAWRFAEPDAAGALNDYESERRPHVVAAIGLSIEAGALIESLAVDLDARRPLRLPQPAPSDPTRWSRLPGLDLGAPFPVGHQVPGPPGLDDALGLDWAWVVASAATRLRDDGVRRVLVEPAATYGFDAVLVRPDRYIAAVSGTPTSAAHA